MEKKTYIVKKAPSTPDVRGEWEDACWKQANVFSPGIVLEDPAVTLTYTPKAECKMLYDEQALYVHWQVLDKYVQAVAKRDQAQVCRDSCAEFFIQPQGSERYFNFEMSCNGRLLLYRIVHLRSGDFEKIPLRELAKVKRFHTLPDRVFPELEEETLWRICYRIPLDFFVQYAKIDPKLSGQTWRGNISVCADHSSHLRWLTWCELPIFDFHYPAAFGDIVFE